MKVILRADVENLGRLGDLVEVKPGYGRNYLLPHGLAMLATPSNLKVFEHKSKKLQVLVEAQRQDAASLADKISAAHVIINMRVGENDKLYGSVTTSLIAESLLEQFSIEVDRRRILLDSPIRLLGEYAVRIRLHADVTAELPVTVAAERMHFEEEAEQVEESPAETEEQENEPEQSAEAE